MIRWVGFERNDGNLMFWEKRKEREKEKSDDLSFRHPRQKTRERGGERRREEDNMKKGKLFYLSFSSIFL